MKATRATFAEFFRLEAAGGILLLVAAVLAMILKNSALGDLYSAFLSTPIQIRIGALDIDKPLVLWVNDGLMAVFFFTIGMEVKREILVGQLRDIRKAVLPVIAGAGGIVAPALIYLWFNSDDPLAAQGWAVPTATDIAFALGILALLGPRVPIGLKLFLMTLAIIDDLGAIIIIAAFYTSNLSLVSLMVALAAITGLAILALRGTQRVGPYMLFGLVLWVSVLKSGVHATLAGVILGLFIPLGPKDSEEKEDSPLRRLIHDLHPWVAFLILPLFAFANAGVNLKGMSPDILLQSVPCGIALGLFVGKQIGVFGFAWIAIKAKAAELPDQVTMSQVYGAALLCGVGFTMSLFIGSLAFEGGGGAGYDRPDRLGIIVGSLVSGLLGYLWLKFTLGRSTAAHVVANAEKSRNEEQHQEG